MQSDQSISTTFELPNLPKIIIIAKNENFLWSNFISSDQSLSTTFELPNLPKITITAKNENFLRPLSKKFLCPDSRNDDEPKQTYLQKLWLKG